ncbi:calcineurin B homologous protein 1 [Procambarus clarkii]|uniref:calcineurin B homologous protein 1 n=1 Tax=Procambarus clarkii TaxID=6728 RepID=UPI001E67516D|nr:calcineurin B homologous protein 1-like [Procambarus clarkii]XP_045620267.1 calcineurin B homologous protein 1-like [Procambarus clarkii]XP_045620268.1 calcineurin B homologous protein 1-like [Procambarus clarkii]
MGNNSSLPHHDLKDIQAETQFLTGEIKELYSRFTSLDTGNKGWLCREDLLCIPELSNNLLCERIVHAIFKESENEQLNFRQFVHSMARFRRIKNSKENKLNNRIEKLRFVFRVYDLDDDNHISLGELREALHAMVGENISEEQLNNIAERTINDADLDGDKMISFDEFCASLERTEFEELMTIVFLR